MSEAPNTPEGVTEDVSVADQVTDQTPAQGDEQLGDDAPAETAEDGSGEKPKPKKTVQDRIDELTRKQRDAEREAEFWRSKALQPQERQRDPEPQVDEDPEPSPYAYEHGENDVRFIRAQAAWEARQEVTRQFNERAQREAEQAERRRFNERAETFAGQTPDFYDVVGQNYERAASVMTEVMQHAARAADEAPALAYHMAKHPAEARRIAALNPYAQAVEIGKLAARLSAPAAPRPTPKTATDAPEPPPQARGAGGRFKVAPDTDDFSAFEQTYG